MSDKERLLSITSSVDNNPYRELVEKYEALLEVQRSQVTNLRKNRKQPAVSVASHSNSAPLSLQEELQISGDFSQFSLKDTDEESGQGESGKVASDTKAIKPAENTTRKNFTRTPDLSEAETSSSGFADETSNKATQTEYDRPGSFLCTIADGEDCKFSIYDDGGSSIDSRFRNRPEYRELFKEIFTILKKAAENKDEGEKLPLLDDTAPAAKVPPVTPAAEEPPGDFTDDTQSVLSSVMSEQSIILSDITPPEGKENISGKLYNANRKENQSHDDIQGSSAESSVEPQKVLTPLVRQPLDYFAGSPHLRKKGSKHRHRKHSQERQMCESPILPSQPKVVQVKGTSRRKRDYRPLESSPLTRTPQENAADWNGSTMQFYNRSVNSPTPSGSGKSGKVYQGWNPDTNSWDIKQSTASQEIHKLKRLELSYAEVLRNADKTKTRRKRHQ